MTERRLEEVALSLRGRRLQLLLDEMRSLRERLKAARRSRHKRARLLSLARKHGFRLSLKRLKVEGVTLWRYGGRVSATYDPCATKQYRLQVLQEWREIRERWETLKNESSDSIAQNLEALLTETELRPDECPNVEWELPDVYLEGVWIGNLRIVMYLDRFTVIVDNTSIEPDDKGGYPHPHVDSGGSICWNGHDHEARAYHANGDFVAVKDLVENLLKTYNGHSPYITLDDWENGVGATCGICGERYAEDDLCWSEQEMEMLCEECRA